MSDSERPFHPTSSTEKPLEAQIVDPGSLPELALPPDAPAMGIAEALFGVVPYWGVKRTITAYRKAVEEGQSATDAVRSLYAAMTDLEMEKERWENVETFREVARNGIQAELKASEARLLHADNDLQQAQMLHDDLKTKLELSDTRSKIISNRLEAELTEAEREKLKAEGKLDELDSHAARMETKLKDARRLRESYQELKTEREKVIAEAGGEDMLDEAEIDILDKLEEYLIKKINDELK